MRLAILLLLCSFAHGQIALQSRPAGLLFQSNFDEFADGLLTPIAGSKQKDPPGWLANSFDGYNVTSGSTIDIVSSVGIGGTKVARLNYLPTGSQPTVSLIKHLGDGGYRTIYVRYTVKFQDLYRFGGAPHTVNSVMKLGRFWQNLNRADDWTFPPTDPPGINGESNRGFCVPILQTIGDGGFQRPQFGLHHCYRSHLGENSTAPDSDPPVPTWSSGSASGPRAAPSYFPYVGTQTGGSLEPWVGTLDTTTGEMPGTQQWMSWEWRLTLATPGNNDGIYEFWINGVKQDAPTYLSGFDLERLPTVAQRAAAKAQIIPSNPTAGAGANEQGRRYFSERIAVGWQILDFFDNAQFFNQNWGATQYYMDLSDVVVSQDRIGHDYVVTGLLP